MLGSKELKVQHKTQTSLCWKEGKEVVDDNTIYQGTRMVFPMKDSIDILEELRMLMMIMTHFSRDFKM